MHAAKAWGQKVQTCGNRAFETLKGVVGRYWQKAVCAWGEATTIRGQPTTEEFFQVA